MFSVGQTQSTQTQTNGLNGVYVQFNNNIHDSTDKEIISQSVDQSKQDTQQTCSSLSNIELDLVEVKTKQTTVNEVTDETYIV